MKTKPIHVFAKWQVNEGQLETVLKYLQEVRRQSLAEEGNLFYRVHQSVTDPEIIFLFEGYVDEAAVTSHRESEHFQTIVVGKIIPLLKNREVSLTNPLELE